MKIETTTENEHKTKYSIVLNILYYKKNFNLFNFLQSSSLSLFIV